MTYRKDTYRARARQRKQLLWVVMGGMLFTACGHGAAVSLPGNASQKTTESPDVGDRQVLAGEWEYEEGGVVVSLILDEQGNGEYAFKGGKFLTGALSDHSWYGMWVQSENDREGGFEVKLSADYSAGEGRWWYTRIDRDTSPTKSGGRFRLIRTQSFPSRDHTSLHP